MFRLGKRASSKLKILAIELNLDGMKKLMNGLQILLDTWA